MSAIPSPWDSPAGSPTFGARLWIGVVDTGGGVYAPRAQLQTASDAAGSAWTAAGDLVAPDVSGDPGVVGATFTATGMQIPIGAATANAGLAQFWGWRLDGGGGLDLGLDPSTILKLEAWFGSTPTGGPHIAGALCVAGATPGASGYTVGIRLPAGATSVVQAAGATPWIYGGAGIDGVLAAHVIAGGSFAAARYDRFIGNTWDATASQTPAGAASPLYVHLLGIRTSVVAAPGTVPVEAVVTWTQKP